MASPNSTFTELVSTTFRNHKKSISDNVSNRNSLLRYINKRGNVKEIADGGLSITQPLDYTTNSTYQRYSDWDALNIAASDTITAAEYQWKQIAINVVASGRELRINSGGSKIIDLATARIKNAMRTFSNNFSTDLYSAGLLSNQVNGLQAIIAGTPTNTIGGIDANTWTFWKNTVQSAAAPLQGGTVTVSATTMEGGMMLPLWLELDRGPDDQPDLIVMDSIYYQYFENSQTSLKRYASSQSADAGFVTLKYKGADVLFDSAIPASTGYMINTEYLHLVVHKDANLEVMEETRPVNQDGVVTPILWMGNLVCSNRAQQGVFKA